MTEEKAVYTVESGPIETSDDLARHLLRMGDVLNRLGEDSGQDLAVQTGQVLAALAYAVKAGRVELLAARVTEWMELEIVQQTLAGLLAKQQEGDQGA